MDQAELLQRATAIQQAWAKAFAARDGMAIAALYAPQVQFWGSTAPLYLSRAGVAECFVTLPADYRRAEYAAPAVLALGVDAFSASGNVTFVRGDALGETARPFRMTHVFTRHGGEWLISVHHASPVP